MSVSPTPADAASPAGPDSESVELRSRREYQFFCGALISTMALTCAIAFSLDLVDPDLWGHVKYGQEVLAERQLPRTATHTYTAPNYRWINHENLSEIAFAAVYEYFGALGLTIGKCLVGMSIVWLMVVVARSRGLGSLATWAFLLLVTINLATFFPVRPQLFSFACCAVMLYVLHRGFPEWPARLEPRFAWLWGLPLVMLVWVNAHGGVVAGLCILLPYLAGRAVELVLREGRAAWKIAGHLAAVAAVSLSMVVVNPYGLALPLWLAHSLSQPRPEVTEWAPLKVSDVVFLPFVLLAALAVLSFLFDRRRRDWVHILLFLPVAWQAVAHVRHIAFFALLAGFWLPGPLNRLIERVQSQASSRTANIVLAPWLRRGLVGLLIAIFCLQTYALTARIRVLPVYRNFYPVDAIEFMADRGLKGRLVAAFNWSQYVLAALSPEVRVQFDGRYDTCYPPEAIDRHFDFLLGEHGGRRFRSPTSGPIDGTAVLSLDEPDMVLVDRSYPESVANMQRELAGHPHKWVLLYQDGIAQLYGRSERFDDPQSPHYLPLTERSISNVTRNDAVPWPALPSKSLSRFAAQKR